MNKAYRDRKENKANKDHRASQVTKAIPAKPRDSETRYVPSIRLTQTTKQHASFRRAAQTQPKNSNLLSAFRAAPKVRKANRETKAIKAIKAIKVTKATPARQAPRDHRGHKAKKAPTEPAYR